MDLVAPGQDIWVARHSTTKYGFVNGTSLSAPLVAGVVGLMLSVSDHLGTPWNDIDDRANTSADGVAHQKRAYDILTFTAEKVVDVNSTFPYSLQTSDQLHRHWAQRMGFGKVNAYRAVAHAVPHKSDYEFTTSTNLVFDPNVTNPDGKKIMHMGAKIHDGLDWILADARGPNPGVLDGEEFVLEYGGTNIPGIPGQTFQNQGVTRIQSNNANVRTDLTVPADCLLIIDGIVKTEEDAFTQSQNRIIAVNTGSRLLMEGLLQNIELVGRMTIGDLIVNGTGLAPGLWFNRGSDVYGTVLLKNDSWWFTVDGVHGATTLRTGSHVRMEGTRNVNIKFSGILELDHSSKISATVSQKVLVENGTLRVLPGCKVEIDAHVHVLDGSTFVIEDSAVVYIKNITVDKGGFFEIKPGAHVMFGSDEIHLNGHFKAVGGSPLKERIVLSTEVVTNNTNCEFDPRLHQYLPTRCRAMLEGDPTDVTKSSVWVSYCDVKNVSFELKTIIKFPIEHCAFTSNRLKPANMPGNVWSTQPYMLLHESYTTNTGLPMLFYNCTISNCSFEDVGGAVPLPVIGYVPNVDRYLLRGIHATNSREVLIENTTFKYLAKGYREQSSEKSTLKFNTFTDSDVGIEALYGIVNTCKNTTDIVAMPMNLAGVERSTHLDNTFNRSRVAVYTLLCQMQAFRNNTFNSYWTGVMNTNSIISMTSLGGNPPSTVKHMYGRNELNVENPVLYMPDGVGHPNPFTRRMPLYPMEVALLADITMNPDGVWLLQCGYNRFSEFATVHIGKSYAPAEVIAVEFNNFRAAGAVRELNVIPTGWPRDIHEVVADNCEIILDNANCSPFTWETSEGRFGKIAPQSEAQPNKFNTQVITSTLVVSKEQLTEELLANAISIQCRINPNNATYSIASANGTTENSSTLSMLTVHIHTLPLGVYALQVRSNNAVSNPLLLCSILTLIIQ